MGINGLLPALKPIAKQVHISKYKGERVAVDGYSWLHKGAYACARELCEGVWTDKYVAYFLSRIQLLRSHGVEPIAVFDGGRLPIKGDEEQARHRARAEARERAAAHLAAGNTAAAVDCYQRCVDITPAMAKCVIEALKAEGVSFIVAPYEADAQMAYLAKRGSVHAVVTEDSDLVAYGCPRVLYKLDRAGSGEELCLQDLPNCPGLPLAGFTCDQFLQLCVMAGCDFLQQLPGIGLKKAHGSMRKYRSFTQVVKMLRFNGTRVPADYEIRFQLAIWAFRHCRVYCPDAQALVHLEPLPRGGLGSADVDVPAALVHLEQQQQAATLDFLGPLLAPEVAVGIAQGRLEPNSHKPFDLARLYEGCPNPPAHIAGQLAPMPHLLALRGPDGGASGKQQCSAASGTGNSGGSGARPRLGLSKKHSGQGKAAGSGAAGRRKSSAAAASASAAGGGSSGKRKSSLGIAKYFAAAAPATAAGQENAAGTQQAAAAAARPSAASQGPCPAAALAGSTAAGGAVPHAVGSAAAASRPSLQHSISAALQSLRQEQHRRQQLQHDEKQRFLADLQQVDAGEVAPMGDEPAAGEPAQDVCSSMQAAKRLRMSPDLEDAAQPAGSSFGSLGSHDGQSAGEGAAAGHALAAGQDVHLSLRRLLGQQQQPLERQVCDLQGDEQQLLVFGSGGDNSLVCSDGGTGCLSGGCSSGLEQQPAAATAVAGSDLLRPEQQQQQSSQWLLQQLDEGGTQAQLGCSSKGAPVSAMAALTQGLMMQHTQLAQAPRPAPTAREEAEDDDAGWLKCASSSEEQEAGRGMFASLQQQQQQQWQPPGPHSSSFVGSRFFGRGPAAGCGSGSLQDSLLSLAGAGTAGEGLLGDCGSGLEVLGPTTGATSSEDDGLPGSSGSLDGLDGVVSPPRRHSLALGAPGALGSAGSGGGGESWRRLQRSLRRGSGSRTGPLAVQLGSGGSEGSGLQQSPSLSVLLPEVAGGSRQQAGRGSLAAGPNRFSRFRAQLVSETQQQQQQQQQQQDGEDDGGWEPQGQQSLQHPGRAGDDAAELLAGGAASGLTGSLLLSLGHVDSLQQQQQQQEEEQEQLTDCSAEEAGAAAAAGNGNGGGGGGSSGGSSSDEGNDENAPPPGADDNAFHSIRHVKGFARLAAKTVRNIQRAQQHQAAAATEPSTAAAAAGGFERFACSGKGAAAASQGPAALRQGHQKRAPLQPATAAVNGAAAAVSQQQQQQQQLAGGVLRPPGLLRKRGQLLQQEAPPLLDEQDAAAAGGPSAAVRKPFRAPWARLAGGAAAVAGSSDSLGLALSPGSDSEGEPLLAPPALLAGPADHDDDEEVQITGEVAAPAAGMRRAGGLGAFGAFACGSQGGAGAGALLSNRQKQAAAGGRRGGGSKRLKW